MHGELGNSTDPVVLSPCKQFKAFSTTIIKVASLAGA